MTGFVRCWRGRLVLPALALGILGAAVAPAATPSEAQVWGPWGPLPGWDTDFPGPLPGPMPGPFPLIGPGPLPGPGPMPPPALSPTEERALGTYLRQLRSISRGNGADAMSLFADDATYSFS